MLLRSEIQAEGLVALEDGSPAPQEHYDVTSYNLRLGREFCLISGRDQHVGDCSVGTGLLRLPPFACALVSTEEVVKLPADVYGRWGLKIRPAMSGLVFQAGPQIEPGSHTRLFGLLFNLSSSEKELHYLTPMWSIDFERLPTAAAAPGRRSTFTMNSYTDKGLPSGSLNEIYSDYRKLQRESTRRRDLNIGVVLAIVTLLAGTVLPAVVAHVVYNRSDVSRAFEENRLLKNELEDIKETIARQAVAGGAPPTAPSSIPPTTTP